VLPFLNLSGDPAMDYLSDAMTDEIIMALAGLAPELLAVIARTTAMRYKGTRKDVVQISREIDVDYIVEGALRHTGDRVSVNVQLIQASDQTHLFARRCEAELRDIFHIQSSIAQGIASHIPSISDNLRAEQVTKKPTENLAAYLESIRSWIRSAPTRGFTRFCAS
jgi:TolB-like protein